MSTMTRLLQRNQDFAANHEDRGLGKMPRLNLVVLCCADPRVDPAPLLGLEDGDAVVLRNLGGRVTPEVERQLAVIGAMTRMLGDASAPPLELAIVHHADCGTESLAAPERRAKMAQASGVDAPLLASLAIADHRTSLIDDIARLERSKLVPSDLIVSAHLHELTTGRLEQVVDPAPLRDRLAS
jgi:carbonic anhydrase